MSASATQFGHNNAKQWHHYRKLVPCGTDGRLLLSGLQALVTLTLTLDRVIRHTVVHHSSSSIYMSNFVEIGKTSWTDYPQRPLQVQGHVTQKLGQIAKIRPKQIQILCSSLRISGHLPASIVNGGWLIDWVGFNVTLNTYPERVFAGQMTQPTVSKHWRQ